MAAKRQARSRRSPSWQLPRPSARALKLGAGVLLLALLFAGGGWLGRQLADPRVMPVRHVGVDGLLRHVSREQLQRRIEEVVIGASFFTVDVDAVRAAAREIPWVDDIRVRKQWPDRLRIDVVEQHAVLRWNDRMLVNARGEAFAAPRASFPPGLANLRGARADLGRLFAAYGDIQRRLRPLGLRVAELERGARGSWRLRLDGGPRVELGRESLERRVARLIALYPRLVADPRRHPVALDLRYANGLAVEWRETEAGLAARERSAGGKS